MNTMPQQQPATPQDDVIDALIAISLLTNRIAKALAKKKGVDGNG